MNVEFSIPSTLPKTGTLCVPVPTLKAKTLPATLRQLDKATAGAVSAHIALYDFKGAAKTQCVIVSTGKAIAQQIILLGVGDGKDLSATAYENLGGRCISHAKKTAEPLQIWLSELPKSKLDDAEIAARIGLGAQLAQYRFLRYKTKQKTPQYQPRRCRIFSKAATHAQRLYKEYHGIAAGVFFARDLINEPANVLSPPEFAKRVRTQLSKLGVKVSIYGETQMKKLGMRTLLGVGQGSEHESQMVVMHWKGPGAKNKKPVVFVGKGVCFDTGGISLKPAPNMEDMKGDMGGAAAVSGTLAALGARKAKVNAYGIIGLVENMPDGKAQRPGDIVKSMSGQTIEVLNTDAEGRLVLADLLWYAQKNLNPDVMVNLATLTGAILVALGQEYAGLFSNSDQLAERLLALGEAENEKLWRMPLCENFDKMIDSKNADMKNIGGGRYAGSCTAAQFLQRFVNGHAWAHLDIAGVGMGSPQSDTNKSWGRGFGVKLLDRFVRTHYE